jgi:hypothetical protein
LLSFTTIKKEIRRKRRTSLVRGGLAYLGLAPAIPFNRFGEIVLMLAMGTRNEVPPNAGMNMCP